MVLKVIWWPLRIIYYDNYHRKRFYTVYAYGPDWIIGIPGEKKREAFQNYDWRWNPEDVVSGKYFLE